MIKAITAHTFEIDDIDRAVSDIGTQLDIGRSLYAHSVGIMSCSSEFVETGVVKAIAEALPFEVIGCTTVGTAVSSALGELMLGLIVLTGTDIIFSAGVSASLIDAQDAPLAAAYQQARERLPGEPALMIAFTPMMKQVTGEMLVETLTKINPALPIFGAQAVDYIDITEFSKSYTLFNGEFFQDVLSFVLIYGDLHPSFFVASVSNMHIQRQKAVVTKSEGNCVMEVNGMPLLTYLEKLGMLGLHMGTGLSFPFMVDYHDGTEPVPRAIYSVHPEGYVIFSGRVPVGATVAVGEMDYPDVLHTARETLTKVMKQKKSCVLLFSCLIRYIVLGADTTAEMEQIRSILDSDKEKSYQFFYSGGEICPVYSEKGKLVNRFHNCSFIVCAL